ncbi:MAG: LPS assembly protein LptD [Sedimentisphaerales bacterium]
MRHNYLIFLLIVFLTAGSLAASGPGQGELFGAEDLHLKGKTLISYQNSDTENILAFTDGFELSIGDNLLKSDKAIVWLDSQTEEYRGTVSVNYKVKVYLAGKVSVDRGAGSQTSGLEVNKNVVSGVESMVANFTVSGEIFATAENRTIEDFRTTKLYHDALVATGQIQPTPVEKPQTVQKEEPVVSQNEEKQEVSQNEEKQEVIQNAQEPNAVKKEGKISAAGKTKKTAAAQKTQRPAAVKDANEGKKTKQGFMSTFFGAGGEQAKPVPQAPVPKIQYPFGISGLGTEPVKITNETLPDGTNIATILSRFYLWQKQNEQGVLLEFQADSAVIFFNRNSSGGSSGSGGLLAGNSVKAVYFRGNIIMTEGQRTIRSDETYYDFQRRQALVINAVMRNYDPQRGIPIYLKAARLRQIAEDKFYAKDVTLTNSEFYVPRISATASEVFVTDTTAIDQKTGELGRQSLDADMRNVKLKLDNRTVFWWPRLRGNLEGSDIPIRSIKISQDKTFGTAIETEWYLAKVLGLRESKGVDSRLMIDSYSKRGTGVGADITYKRETYFGNINGYIINDEGKDDLGRARQDIQPPRTLRGMLNFQHRQFLPEHWQLTLESSYISDEYYLESFHREEYFGGRGQETLAHLKWTKDNEGFAILAKWRINNFADELEEFPSAQYHRTGQSLFNDKFTLYSDSSLGRYRQRIGENHTLNVSQEYFTFGTTRNELDFPLKFSRGNIVPYIAGTYGYDDRYGFDRAAAIGEGTGSQAGEKNVFIGEFGTRASTQFWKMYNVRSRFWDVNGIRHIVKPYVNAAVFAESSDVVKQKNTYSFGVLQRWQTKRGVGEKSRILDWMRLNVEYTMVSDKNSQIKRPDKTVWNKPFVPLSATLAPAIFNGDLDTTFRTFDLFGPQTDSVNADYIWRISDTTAILSDLNYDTTNNKLEQFNIGYSHLCWPNLSYYLGYRYLRDITVDEKKGSKAVTFAITYKLNPRYTISYGWQYDFGMGGLLYNEFSLIRRYHRLYYALTYRADRTLDNTAIVLSIWPEGVRELSLGSRRYMGLDSPEHRSGY